MKWKHVNCRDLYHFPKKNDKEVTQSKIVYAKFSTATMKSRIKTCYVARQYFVTLLDKTLFGSAMHPDLGKLQSNMLPQ